MTAQPQFAAAHSSLPAPLDTPPNAAGWRPVPERSAHEWIDRAARLALPSSSLVVTLDHGTGHWLKALMPLGHRVLAADPSRERLDTLAQRFACPVAAEPAESIQRLAHGLCSSQALLFNGALDALGKLIPASGLKADAVCVNTVGASCPTPEIIFDTCLPCLKDGGLLLYVGNVFVRERDFEWSTISRTIANHRGIPHQQLFSPGSRFDFVALHKEGPVPAREYGHDLGMFARKLSSGAWELVDVDMMEAEGLQHVAPEIGDAEEAKSLIFPAADLQLKKIGLVARKKSL